MALDVDEQSRVTTLGLELKKQFDDAQKSVVQPVARPLFIKHQDGSVSTSSGVPLRGPSPPAPAKPEKKEKPPKQG